MSFQSKNRIEYIDALRGFTMLLVVMYHVSQFSFETNSAILNYFQTFRMPLFFCISGFVFFKTDRLWDRTSVFTFLLKKIKVQLIPTVFFFLLFEHTINHNYIADLIYPSKGGYWFTIALLYFFIIYMAFVSILRYLKVSGIWEDVLLFVLGLFLYALPPILHLTIGFDYEHDPFSITKMRLFLFFVTGTLIRKYYSSFLDLVAKPYIISILLLVSILGYIGIVTVKMGTAVIGTLSLALSFCGVFIAIAFFHKHELSFSHETKIGRVMQYVGRHTLDIYLLHYFVLPRNLSCVGVWFENNPSQFLYLAATIVLAVIVIAFCLCISQIIRLSPVLAHWLLGAKKDY